MKRKNILSIFILTSILLLIGFCLNTLIGKKSFYQIGSGWDYSRFPLLEPYYAINISDNRGWTISLHAKPPNTIIGYTSISNVTKIAVENGMLMVYSTYDKPIQLIGGEKKELHWYILVPDGPETGFEKEVEFNAYLQKLGLDQPQWQDPVSLLEKFDQTGCLDWIPGCK